MRKRQHHNTVLVIMEGDSTISSVNISTMSNMTNFPPSAASVDIYSLPLTKGVIWATAILLTAAVLLGVFGNTMTIIIIRRFRASSSSSALDPYLMMLAVTDLCVVLTGTLLDWIGDATGFHVNRTHDAACKITTFVVNVGAGSSAWILVAMTTQRAVSVAWPHRVTVLCTPRRSWRITLTIVVFFCLAYSHLLYGSGILPSADRACAMTSKSYARFMLTVWVNIDIFLFSLLPFVCLLLSNSVLVLKLKASVRDAGDQFTTTESQQAIRERKTNSVTLTAIVVSAVFIVLTSPLAFYNIFSFTVANTETSAVDLAFRFLLLKMFHLIGYFNYSVNFYLYCLTGEKFRKECRKVLCGWRQQAGNRPKKKPTVEIKDSTHEQ